MSFAILDAQRNIVGIHAKLSPFHTVPSGEGEISQAIIDRVSPTRDHIKAVI